MENENVNENVTLDIDNENTDYIEAIKQLKEKSVSKEDYIKLKEKNKELLNAIVNGDKVETEHSESKFDETETIKKIQNPKNDIEYFENVLALRKYKLETQGLDIFNPKGDDTYRETVNRVAEGIQSCLDYADGDNGVFINEYQRITKDLPIIKAKAK